LGKKHKDMAVTIVQNPDTFTPACNPIVWTFSSNQTAQPNFSFYVEFYVQGNLHSAHTVFPESGIYGKFDASQIMRALTTTPVADSAFVQDFGTAMLTCYVDVYERYGTTPTLQANTAANIRRAFNGSFKYRQFINWNSDNYDVKEVDGALFTTYFPRSEKAWCRYDEYFFLGLFGKRFVMGDVWTMFIELYDSAGNLINNDAYNIGYERYWELNVGPEVIVANTSIVQANFDQCAYYQIYVRFSDGVTTNYTEVFTIWYDQECTTYNPVRLHWLNKFGVYDSFSFDLVSQTNGNVTANNYQRQLGQWGNSGAYSFLNNAPQMQHYSKRSIEQMIINSDWIKEAVQHWLVEELYESPRVYIEQGSQFVPVMVTNPNYVKKLRRKDGLIQELVQLDKTYEYISQLN
jgi:hypothetical protein